MKNTALIVVLAIASVALSACGNKGPLVKPSDIPAATPVTPELTPAEVEPVADPDVTPAARR